MNFRRWGAAVLIILATVAGLGFLKFQQVQAAIAFGESFPETSASVNTMVTSAVDYSTSYKVTGQARATQVVTLHNQLPGTIEKVNFRAGDLVKEGQLLLSLNVSEEIAQLNSAKASYTLAEATLKRNKKLLKGKKVSQQVVDAALADYQVAIANIANLESVISKKQVVAPFSGRVGLDTFEVGQFLAASSEITTLIGDNDEMWIDFKLPQTREKLAVGDSVAIQQINRSLTNPMLSAIVVAKQTQMESGSRHQKYRVVLDNKDGSIIHNELVNTFIVAKPQAVMMVPNLAITRGVNGSYVYQLLKDDKGDYRAQKLSVELGPREGDDHVVLSGLDEGMFIATVGAFKLSPGLLVYPSAKESM